MAFIVEDGTNVADANSLVSVTFADDYFSTLLVTSWASLTTPQKQAALIKSTSYVNDSFTFIGYTSFQNQSLAFPREYSTLATYQGIDLSPIPKRVKQAVCEAAIYALTNDLYKISSEDVSAESKTLEGVGTISKTYAKSPSMTELRISKVDTLLKPYLYKKAKRFCQ
jgi:hypothetical protein